MSANALLSVAAWAPVHGVWEGAVVAAMAEVALAFVGSAVGRYRVALSALAVGVAAPVVTAVAVGPTAAPAFLSGLPSTLLGVVVVVWAGGAVVLLGRAAVAWVVIGVVRRRRVSLLEDGEQLRLLRLARGAGLRSPVWLTSSSSVSTPLVVGHHRPTIVLPDGARDVLTAPQLEVVLGHEVAHIARNDYLVNLLQVVVESVAWFNPFVWRLSGQVRLERELACDGAATRGDRRRIVELVEGLTRLERRRRPPALALAATSQLTLRARHLLGGRGDGRRARALAVGVALLVGGGALGLSSLVAISVTPTMPWREPVGQARGAAFPQFTVQLAPGVSASSDAVSSGGAWVSARVWIPAGSESAFAQQAPGPIVFRARYEGTVSPESPTKP